jgi:hypothetical protein
MDNLMLWLLNAGSHRMGGWVIPGLDFAVKETILLLPVIRPVLTADY